MSTHPLRHLPSVSELLESPALRTLIDRVSHSVVAGHIRAALDEIRGELKSAADESRMPNLVDLPDRIAERIMAGEAPSLRPVINATGILLHTGLGRAPLAEEAVQAMLEVARDYASVELDLATGQRSQRVVAVEGLLRELTGAEAAVVVNNNAGATMLTLAAIAPGREVIVSRGQLIEIGGSFRLPDVMQTSGAILKEVGTTNKTHLSDYRTAIGPQTAALMRCHPSNFVVLGFTAEVSLDELVALGQEHQLPVIDDIGSGAIIDFAQFGFSGEPVAGDSIARGADLVLFSGDKLLGGPQCGIVVGKRASIAKLAKHPMMRALRVDKLTLAALAATLRLYRRPEVAKERIPLLRMLCTTADELQHRATQLCDQLRPSLMAVAGIHAVEPVADFAFPGGGSIPTQKLPTWCVSLQADGGLADRLATRLRTGTPSVVCRVQQGRLLLDLRSVLPHQDAALAPAVLAAITP